MENFCAIWQLLAQATDLFFSVFVERTKECKNRIKNAVVLKDRKSDIRLPEPFQIVGGKIYELIVGLLLKTNHLNP